jgi:hypothetical protein
MIAAIAAVVICVFLGAITTAITYEVKLSKLEKKHNADIQQAKRTSYKSGWDSALENAVAVRLAAGKLRYAKKD